MKSSSDIIDNKFGGYKYKFYISNKAYVLSIIPIKNFHANIKRHRYTKH